MERGPLSRYGGKQWVPRPPLCGLAATLASSFDETGNMPRIAFVLLLTAFTGFSVGCCGDCGSCGSRCVHEDDGWNLAKLKKGKKSKHDGCCCDACQHGQTGDCAGLPGVENYGLTGGTYSGYPAGLPAGAMTSPLTTGGGTCGCGGAGTGTSTFAPSLGPSSGAVSPTGMVPGQTYIVENGMLYPAPSNYPTTASSPTPATTTAASPMVPAPPVPAAPATTISPATTPRM